jgi:hypothetical protein
MEVISLITIELLDAARKLDINLGKNGNNEEAEDLILISPIVPLSRSRIVALLDPSGWLERQSAAVRRFRARLSLGSNKSVVRVHAQI